RCRLGCVAHHRAGGCVADVADVLAFTPGVIRAQHAGGVVHAQPTARTAGLAVHGVTDLAESASANGDVAAAHLHAAHDRVVHDHGVRGQHEALDRHVLRFGIDVEEIQVLSVNGPSQR